MACSIGRWLTKERESTRTMLVGRSSPEAMRRAGSTRYRCAERGTRARGVVRRALREVKRAAEDAAEVVEREAVAFLLDCARAAGAMRERSEREAMAGGGREREAGSKRQETRQEDGQMSMGRLTQGGRPVPISGIYFFRIYPGRGLAGVFRLEWIVMGLAGGITDCIAQSCSRDQWIQSGATWSWVRGGGGR